MKKLHRLFYFKIAVDLHAAFSVIKRSSFYSFKNVDHLRMSVLFSSNISSCKSSANECYMECLRSFMDTLKDNLIVRFITEITLSLTSCLPLSKQVEISCVNTAVTSYLSHYGKTTLTTTFVFILASS